MCISCLMHCAPCAFAACRAVVSARLTRHAATCAGSSPQVLEDGDRKGTLHAVTTGRGCQAPRRGPERDQHACMRAHSHVVKSGSHSCKCVVVIRTGGPVKQTSRKQGDRGEATRLRAQAAAPVHALQVRTTLHVRELPGLNDDRSFYKLLVHGVGEQVWSVPRREFPLNGSREEDAAPSVECAGWQPT